jgi:hypothetical protein
MCSFVTGDILAMRHIGRMCTHRPIYGAFSDIAEILISFSRANPFGARCPTREPIQQAIRFTNQQITAKLPVSSIGNDRSRAPQNPEQVSFCGRIKPRRLAGPGPCHVENLHTMFIYPIVKPLIRARSLETHQEDWAGQLLATTPCQESPTTKRMIAGIALDED